MRPFARIMLGAMLLLAGCGGTLGTPANPTVPIPNPGPTPPASGITVVSHVAIVVLENTNFADANNATNMPYLNSLLSQGSLASTYYANAHPSEPDYFIMTDGLPETLDDNFTGTVSDDNVVRRLVAAGMSWKAYAESLPSPGYLGGDVQPYLRRHNPLTFFSDVQQSSVQSANIVGTDQMSSDIAAGTLPNYSFIVPNAVDDAHDCPHGG